PLWLSVSSSRFRATITCGGCEPASMSGTWIAVTCVLVQVPSHGLPARVPPEQTFATHEPLGQVVQVVVTAHGVERSLLQKSGPRAMIVLSEKFPVPGISAVVGISPLIP